MTTHHHHHHVGTNFLCKEYDFRLRGVNGSGGDHALLPRFGMGLSHQQGGWDANVIASARERGVRLFDTAARYGSEADLGKALRVAENSLMRIESRTSTRDNTCSASTRSLDSILPAKVTTKIWPDDLPIEGSPDEFARAVKDCLHASETQLGGSHPSSFASSPSSLPTIDLLLLHFPLPYSRGRAVRDPRAWRRKVWNAMVELKKEGLVGGVGVSNFCIRHLRDLYATDAVPCVNQIEINPYQHPHELLEEMNEYDIVAQGYAPFAKGRALDSRVVIALAEKYTLDTVTVGGSGLIASSSPSYSSSSYSSSSSSSCASRSSPPIATAAATTAAATTTTTTSSDTFHISKRARAAQVLIKWSLQKSIGCIPKTRKMSHLKSNLAAAAGLIPDLPPEAMETLDALHADWRVTWDSSSVP